MGLTVPVCSAGFRFQHEHARVAYAVSCFGEITYVSGLIMTMCTAIQTAPLLDSTVPFSVVLELLAHIEIPIIMMDFFCCFRV